MLILSLNADEQRRGTWVVFRDNLFLITTVAGSGAVTGALSMFFCKSLKDKSNEKKTNLILEELRRTLEEKKLELKRVRDEVVCESVHSDERSIREMLSCKVSGLIDSGERAKDYVVDVFDRGKDSVGDWLGGMLIKWAFHFDARDDESCYVVEYDGDDSGQDDELERSMLYFGDEGNGRRQGRVIDRVLQSVGNDYRSVNEGLSSFVGQARDGLVNLFQQSKNGIFAKLKGLSSREDNDSNHSESDSVDIDSDENR